MKIVVNGKESDATPIAFTSGGEMAGSVLLDNGVVLKVRVIVTEVLQLEGVTDPLGRPAYLLQHQTIVVPA